MKQLCLGVATAMALGVASPAFAADYMTPPPSSAAPAQPRPMTCLEHAWAHYNGHRPVLASPFIWTRAALCRVFHPFNRVYHHG